MLNGWGEVLGERWFKGIPINRQEVCLVAQVTRPLLLRLWSPRPNLLSLFYRRRLRRKLSIMKWFFRVRAYWALYRQMVESCVADRNKVLGDGQWSWEDKHMLMLKSWHPAFNPESESFDQTLIWIGLPNLPMQYWFDSYFEVVGNSLSTFLMTDDDYLNLLHTTFARLLVVVDVSMGLPSENFITSSRGNWLQSVDYEGIPFRCRICFKTRNNVDSCTRLRVKRTTS
ncbi:hypothetical protein SUGI_0454040 [Cryptomeria japonica]|nr:hypothetical protein SUGI_0454040 [Cryptomeria japonica]